jgi:stalled ribosome rescue protein Dom34
MTATRLLTLVAILPLVLALTGCFRVSSDTRALRDAALESGFGQVDEKIEVGVGFFTVGLAKLASKYVDIPPEARTALRSLKGAECAVYEVHQRRGSLSSILEKADKAMERQGCERLVGVIHEHDLVAVYVPREMASARNIQASVLVLNRDQLVCVTARADAEGLMELALSRLREELPGKSVAGSFVSPQAKRDF